MIMAEIMDFPKLAFGAVGDFMATAGGGTGVAGASGFAGMASGCAFAAAASLTGFAGALVIVGELWAGTGVGFTGVLGAGG